jgi:hypothetical protein
MKKILLLALYFGLSVSCQAPSSTHQAQRELPDIKPEVPQYEQPVIQKANWVTLEESGFDSSYNPKVDILFVIDNSASMKQVQTNVARNIDQFINQFSQNESIDFQIGVTTNWDHYTEKFQQAHPDGAGALRPIPNFERRFFKKGDENLVQKLRQTLQVGILPLQEGGPEHEAFLSPVLGALEKTGRGDVNEGFIRSDAHLVVILVTDADDMTPTLSPSEAAEKLIEIKGSPDKVSVFGVLVGKEDPDSVKDMGLRKTPKYHPECFIQKGKQFVDNGLCPRSFGPDRLEQFIFSANARLGSTESIGAKRILRITSPDFGRGLMNFAQDIVAQVSEKRIMLPVRPQISAQGAPQIELLFGTSEKLETVPQNAYQYLPKTNEITILKPWKKKIDSNGRFVIRVLPLLILTE